VVVAISAVAVALAVTSALARPARALENGLAKTPPMGWNSWNTFGCDIDEHLIRDTADAIVSSGLRDAGYEYVNIDDCWEAPTRDAQGRLRANPERFPSGIATLADYVHADGLKLGIYSTAGTGTCQRLPGSLGHETTDAHTFASWGVDYLKYDHCFTEKSDLPDIDAATVSGHGIATSDEAEDAHLSGTAAVVNCAGCSGGARVGSLRGGNRAAVDFTLSVPTDGTYRLDIAYVYGSDPRTSYYPTGFVAVGDTWVSDRIRFTPSPDSRTPATYRIDVPLRAGENHVRLANPMSDLDVKRDNFARMRDALLAAGRPIIYSINPNTLDGTSFADIANLWRTTQDIKPLWHSTSWYRGVDDIINENGPLADATGPGGWNDPDMLEVGVTLAGFPGLTADEVRTHMSMWAMMAAPLIAGADVRSMTEQTRETLGNGSVLAVDQDVLGRAGRRVRADGDGEIWVRPLHNGDRAVVLRNRGAGPTRVTATTSDVGIGPARRYLVRDLWGHRAEVRYSPELSTVVPAHGALMYRVHAVAGG
jgi:alpha-galactosidase